jgi:hypothetical protein
LRGEGLAGEPGPAGQSPSQGDGEPAPQLGGARVEQHRVGVVVAVRAQRLTEPVIVPGVLLAAGQADAVRADLALPARSAGQDPAVLIPAGVDRAERRRGQRDEDARVAGDGGGDALAAGEPGADELVGVGAVDLGAGRAAGGAAGLAGDRQDAAGVGGQWCSGGSVRRCRRRCSRRGRAAEPVAGTLRCAGWDLRGQGWAKAVLLSSGVDERKQAAARRVKVGFADQRCCAACGAWLRVACRSGVSCNGVCTVTRELGDSPIERVTREAKFPVDVTVTDTVPVAYKRRITVNCPLTPSRPVASGRWSDMAGLILALQRRSTPQLAAHR